MQNSSTLLVQADEGVSVLVVDQIGDIYRSLPRRADVIVTTVGARHKCQQGSGLEPPMKVSLEDLMIYRPSANTQSPSLSPGELLATPQTNTQTLLLVYK
ncbi:2-alkenal reductase (NADP(+)-dependent)-like [Dorcoceras hygrometricum]|uniref:2-alkenal reductase (NADP(+)-dependent)-like n=1 Tax=Dorcoceras hygrometricum TaxID=472368 RepID=A0A2Z7D5R6_9LAMI|nr:2-alkenal reductase (NADP(+)-dependent)-like [Dorcoceras hygrometricum]